MANSLDRRATKLRIYMAILLIIIQCTLDYVREVNWMARAGASLSAGQKSERDQDQRPRDRKRPYVARWVLTWAGRSIAQLMLIACGLLVE